jgi:hypothetical protein
MRNRCPETGGWYANTELGRTLADTLGSAFTHSLNAHEWGVDVQLDEGMFHDQAPLEDFRGTAEEHVGELKSRLKQAAEGTLGHEKKALIVYNSHMGGEPCFFSIV